MEKNDGINFSKSEINSTLFIPFTVTENDQEYGGTLMVHNNTVGGMPIDPEYEVVWVEGEPENWSKDDIIEAYENSGINGLNS